MLQYLTFIKQTFYYKLSLQIWTLMLDVFTVGNFVLNWEFVKTYVRLGNLVIYTCMRAPSLPLRVLQVLVYTSSILSLLVLVYTLPCTQCPVCIQCPWTSTTWSSFQTSVYSVILTSVHTSQYTHVPQSLYVWSRNNNRTLGNIHQCFQPSDDDFSVITGLCKWPMTVYHYRRWPGHR